MGTVEEGEKVMGILEIPKSFEYTCDACGEKHVQKNASGHYTNSCPPHWAQLMLVQDAYDYQGAAVADGTLKRLLCRKCTEIVSDAINAALQSSEGATG